MVRPMGTSLEGQVQQIRYTNEESFWTVAGLKVDGQAQPVSAVGPMPGVEEGMRVRLSGRWDENPRFGRQFKVEHFEELVPATERGLVGYLASGFVPGVGPAMAKRIVERFGTETVDVIMREPERLAEVSGLGKKRVQAIIDAFQERRGAQDALVFLFGLGIPRGLALRIYRRYRENTIAFVKRSPYKLAEEVLGVGFQKADQVARGLEIALDDPGRLRAGVYHCLRVARDDGHCFVPRAQLVTLAVELLGVDAELVDRAVSALAVDGKVVIDGAPGELGDVDVVYLSSLYEAEVESAFHLASLLSRATSAQDAVGDRVTLAAGSLGIALARGQEAAVRLALEKGTVIVTGGPGTGKTTIIRTLLEACGLPEAKVALAAPTGRAAKRMSEATEREAVTIHRLLEFAPAEGFFQRDESNPLEVELVIIDEASMVDLPLFYALIRAIPAGAHLVLVGDQDQLPPVGPGSPLTDLIRSERVPVARLTEIFRQGAGSAIVEGAHRVNRGEPLTATPPGTPLQDFYFIAREDPEHICQTIEKLVTDRIPERFGFDPMRDVQVLSPMRVGPIGIDALNERLQALLNPLPQDVDDATRRSPFRVRDKVMQIRNDYDRGVFNGDLGFVRHVDPKAGSLSVVIDDREVVYDREQREDLVLAYAVTIHKSQGSEYPAVVLPVSTHHYKMLRRNLLYTGITRGKRLVVLVGTERAMRIAVGNRGLEERNTQLDIRLGRALDGALDLR
ncbi:MAG: ATP-dependent RecD-like DNA helicase [Deltaproteobacteria bacterium]|nr:MAG: ATP-dependent RecD-like DNA helicase [Deltaproteobacteria bacterium]